MYMKDYGDLIYNICDFVTRRFSKDCDWMNGNCLWFAQILVWRFSEELTIYYEPVVGHFYAGTQDGRFFFDWEGYYNEKFLENKPILLSDIAYLDETWYSRLMRDCMK